MDPRLTDTLAAYDAHVLDYQEQWRDARPVDAVRRFAGRVGRGGRVLDVAAGPGLDLRLLRDAGLKVAGGDLSHAAMKIAGTLFPKGALARFDFRRLPFADGTFDGIWAPAALQHAPRAHFRRVLSEWRRVQRRGPLFLSLRMGGGDLEAVDEPGVGTVHVTTVTEDELRALLLDAGYTDVEVEPRPDLHGRSDVAWLHGIGTLPARTITLPEPQAANRSAR